MYEKEELYVLNNESISQPFHTNAGVNQGSPNSPLLFSIVLDEIMSEIYSQIRSTTSDLSRLLEVLDYADDIFRLLHKIWNTQSKLKDLERLANSVGLEIEN